MAMENESDFNFIADSIIPLESEIFMDEVGHMTLRNQVIAKAMVQLYPEIDNKMLFKHPDELKMAASHADRMFITDNHPYSVIVTSSDSIKGRVVPGTTTWDGKFIKGDLKITDTVLQDKIRKGKIGISPGFMCVIDWTPGDFEGTKYDGIQRKFILDSLAIVEEGRCRKSDGCKLKMKLQSQSPSGDSMTKGDKNNITEGQLIIGDTIYDVTKIQAILADSAAFKKDAEIRIKGLEVSLADAAKALAETKEKGLNELGNLTKELGDAKAEIKKIEDDKKLPFAKAIMDKSSLLTQDELLAKPIEFLKEQAEKLSPEMVLRAGDSGEGSEVKRTGQNYWDGKEWKVA